MNKRIMYTLLLPALWLTGCQGQPAGQPIDVTVPRTVAPQATTAPLPGVGGSITVKAAQGTLTVSLMQVVAGTTTTSSVAVRKPGTSLVAAQLRVHNNGQNGFTGIPKADLRNAAGNQVNGVFMETPVGESFPLSYSVGPDDSYLGIMSFEVSVPELTQYTHLYFSPSVELPATVWQVALS